ncbi:MAG: hypothetical protein HZB39_19345, partial [Planctomycetes bacterium]|nr:hypothetical protein [Planctomycetota bacterium]
MFRSSARLVALAMLATAVSLDGSLQAQSPEPGPSVAPVLQPGARLTGVLVDEPGDGNTWVLAPGYKARFGNDAVEFIPYFGPRAPRNFPVALRLESVRRGDRELDWRRDVAPKHEAMRVD